MNVRVSIPAGRIVLVEIIDGDKTRGDMFFAKSDVSTPHDWRALVMDHKAKFIAGMRRRIGAALDPLLGDIDAAFELVAA